MSVVRELHVRAAPEVVVTALHARLGRSDDGSSQGLIINFDWGAAGAYADEAVAIIRMLEEESGS
ncbi:MAG: hypothetical protein AB1492_07085 [Bacillota bacterium]